MVTHTNGIWGAGVATVDFDLDGDVDLAVLGEGQPMELWRNEGGSFVNNSPALVSEGTEMIDRYYKKMHWKGSLGLDGGTLFTQFSHFVDIMYWLFGDITNIQARFRDYNHAHSTDFEDSGNVAFDFLNGGSGTLNFSTSVAHTNFESSMTIIAQNGTVKIGGQYMNEVEYCNIADYEMPELPEANPANDYGHYKGSAANHVYVIDNAVNSLRGKTTITTNAMEGLKVVEIDPQTAGPVLPALHFPRCGLQFVRIRRH